MTNLNINYNLTKNEILLFPLVPTYGLRHLNKEGWINKTLGLIELFPVLGPLVACIEGIVHTILRKSVEKSPSASVNDSQGVEKAWFEEFKKKALAHFNTVKKSGRIDEQKPKLELTQEQFEALRAVVNLVNEEYLMEAEKLVDWISANHDTVFSLKEIPGWIFKMNTDRFTDFIEGRYQATKKAKRVIDEYNLTFLHVPAQEILEIRTEEGRVLKVLAEEKYDILSDLSDQKSLFQYCLRDPDLKSVGQEYVRQLIILILKTNYADVRYDNNPILSNGQGIGLIDMDCRSRLIGLREGYSSTRDHAILRYLTSDLIEIYEPLIKENLTEQEFQDLNLEKIKQEQKAEEEKTPEFLKFLENHRVKTCKETVNWQSRFTFFYKDKYIEEFEVKINEMASRNLGLYPELERKFCLNEANYPTRDNLLNKLKDENKIFDWTVPSSGNGYYIYC